MVGFCCNSGFDQDRIGLVWVTLVREKETGKV